MDGLVSIIDEMNSILLEDNIRMMTLINSLSFTMNNNDFIFQSIYGFKENEDPFREKLENDEKSLPKWI